jgi:hypothetical protein
VRNWLDTMSHQKGFVWGRMDRANHYEPKAIKVRVSDLLDHLPAGTREVTPDERDAEIRRRRTGAQLRRRLVKASSAAHHHSAVDPDGLTVDELPQVAREEDG